MFMSTSTYWKFHLFSIEIITPIGYNMPAARPAPLAKISAHL